MLQLVFYIVHSKLPFKVAVVVSTIKQSKRSSSLRQSSGKGKSSSGRGTKQS